MNNLTINKYKFLIVVLFFVTAFFGSNTVYADDASLTVYQNVEAVWSISPGGHTGDNQVTGPFFVDSVEDGIVYTITPGDVPGYSYEVTNSDSEGEGSSMMIFPGQSKSFTITYTPDSPEAQITVHSPWPWESGRWYISPGDFTGIGTLTLSVPAGMDGSLYTLTPSSMNGYSFEVTNSDSGEENLTIFPGESKSFTIQHTALPFDYSLVSSGDVVVSKSAVPVNAVGTIAVTKTVGEEWRGVEMSSITLPDGVSVTYTNHYCTSDCVQTLTFEISPTVAVGTYPITAEEGDCYFVGDDWGDPQGHICNNKTVSFDLVVNSASSLVVACEASPSPAELRRDVLWSVDVAGGSGDYTYEWSGTDFPTAPAPSDSSYTMQYETVGLKQASVVVNDSEENQATCSVVIVLVSVRPQFEEL